MSKKDLRNVKQTQFDRGQVLKGSFSEQSSALRTTKVNSILKDTYTHFFQTFDDQSRLTKVTYYQATEPAIDSLLFVADVSASLRSTYILVEEFLTGITRTFYIKVDGIGVAPGLSDIETAVNISANDAASVVCLAFKNELDGIDGFIISRKGVLATSLEIEYLQFGETSAVNIDDTGFTVNRTQEGDSIEVGEVVITYDSNGDMIYNGSSLKGLTYNPFSASFEVNTVYTIPPSEEEGSTQVEVVGSETHEELVCIFTGILKELKKINIHNSIVSDNVITDEDIE